ncbi:MAG: hypothetical protein WEE66_05520 [Actinomycetota bacterium]
MYDEVRARLWHTGGRFYAQVLDAPVFLEVTGVSRRECLAELRKATGDDVTLTIEVVPDVVGVAEAAEIMGWDKRRVVTYIDRGSFPEPITALASGRIWLRDDVQAYADGWRARHATKARKTEAAGAVPAT